MDCSIKVEIFFEEIGNSDYEDISIKLINSIFTGIADFLGLNKKELTLILTDNKYIKSINKKYRNKDNSTDVISFANRDNPFPEIKAGFENLGDIYISLEKTDEQSREYGVSFIDELKRLLIHGFLHLAGYDHEKSEKDEKDMKNLEEKLFQLL